MKKIWLLIIALMATTASAQLYKIETNEINLIYGGKGLSYLSPYSVKCFTNAWQFHKEIWDYQPDEQVVIFLNDFTDGGNGGALVMPWNYVTINVAPFAYDFDIIPASERMHWLMDHELMHIVATDKPSSGDRFWRGMFGGKVMADNQFPLSMIYSYLTVPRWYSPRWYQEGIAVFMETWMSGGLGRAIGGYDEMVFRTMTLDSAYFYRVVGLETEGTAIDFQVGVNSYLYGTRFTDYLAYEYGADKLMQFYSRTDSSSKFYANQFYDVYGISVDEAWENWIGFEKKFQRDNLRIIEEYPVTRPVYITDGALGSVSRAFFDEREGKIYCAVNHPGDMARIVSIDIRTGEMEDVRDVLSPKLNYVTSLAADMENDLLFQTTCNNTWRGLESISIEGAADNLMDYSRTGNLVVNPADKSLWGVQVMSGRTAIVRSAPPYESFTRMYSIPFGQSFFSPDISPDGRLLSGTLADAAGRQRLVLFNTDSLLAGINEHKMLYEFEDNSASDFRFSEDGRYLYGTSYYTGVSNVFRIETATGEMAALTNARRGFFRPLDLGGDSLLVWEYTTGGMRPGIIRKTTTEDINAITYLGQEVFERNPKLREWNLDSPAQISLDSLGAEEEEYNSFANFGLASVYPIIEGFKVFPAYGLRFHFMDNVGFNSLAFNISYSPNRLLPERQRLHFFMDYKYWQWNLQAGYNRANFYDLFGPTRVSRAGYMLYGSYHDFLLYNEKPRQIDYTIGAAMYGDLETLPGYQNVAASIDRMYYAHGELNYSLTRKSLGAVESESGIKANLTADAAWAADIVHPRLSAKLDYGWLTPLRNTSLWLRTSAGWGFADRERPLSNFYFGGFGNNYVDYHDSHRYREMESFPGLNINEAAANKFAKAQLELNLQPVRFRRFGFLHMYATHARMSLFGSAIATDPDRPALRRYIYNAGAQMDMEIVFFSLLRT
ncbi:MAG: hypothetical protein ACOCX7_00640, partial [Bacteroidota bacterium]